MSWITDNKGQGPWSFTEKQDVWGYLNNPRWSSLPKAVEFSEAVGNPIDTTDTHKPCGHWHKGDTATIIEDSTDVTTYTYITYHLGSWWQQSLDIGDIATPIIYRGLTSQAGVVNKTYIKNNAVTCNRQGIIGSTVGNSRVFTAVPSPNVYVGAPNYDYDQFAGIKSDPNADEDTIILVSNLEDDNPIFDEEQFNSLSITPPTIIRCYDYTVIAGEVWGIEDGDGYYTNYLIVGVKKDNEDQYWKVAVDKFAGWKDILNGDLYPSSPYFCEAFNNGTIVLCYECDNYVSGDIEIYVVRSTDYGVTWGSEILVSSTSRGIAYIKKGDDGDLYISSYKSQTAKIYISTDKGLTWTEKDLPNLLTAPTENAWGYMDFSVDVNGVIYAAIPRWTFFSLYVSSDGGDNWTRYDHNEITRPLFITANDTSIIVHGADTVAGSPSHYLLLKSSDGGINFAEVADLTDLGYAAIQLQTLKHNGETFIFTYCAMQDDEGRIAWLISEDNGDTWVEDSLENLMNVNELLGESQEVLTNTDVTTVTTELTEPQVWQI